MGQSLGASYHTKSTSCLPHHIYANCNSEILNKTRSLAWLCSLALMFHASPIIVLLQLIYVSWCDSLTFRLSCHDDSAKYQDGHRGGNYQFMGVWEGGGGAAMDETTPRESLE